MHISEQFPAFVTIIWVARQVSQAAGSWSPPNLSRKPEIFAQGSHADSGLCRWDSDDLSEISDDEWDDDA